MTSHVLPGRFEDVAAKLSDIEIGINSVHFDTALSKFISFVPASIQEPVIISNWKQIVAISIK